MTYCFYFFVCLCLIILQTAILPSFSIFDDFYDLLTAFVIYLGIFRPVRESLPVVILLGFIMDNLSGAPFGIYLTSYLWLYVGMTWIIKYVHVNNSVLVLFVVAAGVFIENIFYFGTVFLAGPEGRLPVASGRTVVIQVAWATLSGPFFLTFLDRLHRGWEMLLERLASREHNQGF